MIEIKPTDGTTLYARADAIVAVIIASRFSKQATNSAVIIGGGQVPITAQVSEAEGERIVAVLRSLKPESFVDVKPVGMLQ